MKNKQLILLTLVCYIILTGLIVGAQQTPTQVAAGAQKYASFSDQQLEQAAVYLLSYILQGSAITASSLSTGAAAYGGFSDRDLAAAEVYLLNQIGTGLTSGGFPGQSLIYVATNGSDSASGAFGAPVLTPKKAASLVQGTNGATVNFGPGDFGGQFALSNTTVSIYLSRFCAVTNGFYFTNCNVKIDGFGCTGPLELDGSSDVNVLRCFAIPDTRTVGYTNFAFTNKNFNVADRVAAVCWRGTNILTVNSAQIIVGNFPAVQPETGYLLADLTSNYGTQGTDTSPWVLTNSTISWHCKFFYMDGPCCNQSQVFADELWWNPNSSAQGLSTGGLIAHCNAFSQNSSFGGTAFKGMQYLRFAGCPNIPQANFITALARCTNAFGFSGSFIIDTNPPTVTSPLTGVDSIWNAFTPTQ